MDFDSILDQWENRQDRRKPSSVSESPEVSEQDWLERYPPGSDVVLNREKVEVTPVSEGRSIWLRRAHQDTLDLHGLTTKEAREEMARFIQRMRKRGFRKGLIIHGKGLHSTDGSVLAPLVRKYLEMSSEIGEIGRASRKDGGSGATWFVLRQRSR